MTVEADISELADRPRPAVHFAPASNWMNDPNGLIFWNGYYHLFYQKRELRKTPALLCWGHARSVDLLHWEDLPVALVPTPGSPDEDGCFSGCAVVYEGAVFLIYTGVQGSRQLPCLARASDDDLISFEKWSGNPLIAEPPVGDVLGFRDHTIREVSGELRQLVGSGTPALGGCVFEYQSRDLLTWNYAGVFLSSLDSRLPGSMWECPDLFALDTRWHLVISSHIDHPIDVHYASGVIESNHFVLTASGRVDLGMRWYAPQSFTAPDGRRIVFGWLRERESEVPYAIQKRVGVMSLPREYFERADGSLGVRPCREIIMLRGSRVNAAKITNSEIVLNNAESVEAVEVVIEDPGGPGEMFIELLDEDGDLQVGVAFGGSDIAVASRGRPSVSSGERPEGAIRFFFDGGICEAFTSDGRACSEIIYGVSAITTVRVTSSSVKAPLDEVAVEAFVLKGIW